MKLYIRHWLMRFIRTRDGIHLGEVAKGIVDDTLAFYQPINSLEYE